MNTSNKPRRSRLHQKFKICSSSTTTDGRCILSLKDKKRVAIRTTEEANWQPTLVSHLPTRHQLINRGLRMIRRQVHSSTIKSQNDANNQFAWLQRGTHERREFWKTADFNISKHPPLNLSTSRQLPKTSLTGYLRIKLSPKRASR